MNENSDISKNIVRRVNLNEEVDRTKSIRKDEAANSDPSVMVAQLKKNCSG